MAITEENLENWFTHHPPTKDQIDQYHMVRAAGKAMALAVLNNTPPSADQTTAIRKVREAVMTANAAIACGGK